MNCEGRIVVHAERCGAATALADIVHAVEVAQARAAPVQRLADRAAGGFAMGVLALSTATFAFWATAGPHLFPQASHTVPSAATSSSLRDPRMGVAAQVPACAAHGKNKCSLRGLHMFNEMC